MSGLEFVIDRNVTGYALRCTIQRGYNAAMSGLPDFRCVVCGHIRPYPQTEGLFELSQVLQPDPPAPGILPTNIELQTVCAECYHLLFETRFPLREPFATVAERRVVDELDRKQRALALVVDELIDWLQTTSPSVRSKKLLRLLRTKLLVARLIPVAKRGQCQPESTDTDDDPPV